jgi:hypothetical protein
MSTNLQITTSSYQRTARAAGVAIPEAISAVLDPAVHPRAQLDKHLSDIPTTEAAIAQALNAGKNPATDKGVILAINAQRVRERTGNLDAVQDRRITAAFREQWDAIVDAVQAVFDPAAEAFTRAHQVLAAHSLDHEDTDAIRRAGGEAVTAWAAALTAQEVLAQVPTILTNAAISAGHAAFGDAGRMHWTIVPNLDTWISAPPNTKDLWSVLDSGATLNLARNINEAQQRAALPHRERALANEARAAANGRGGFGGDDRPISYIGADGKRRTTDHNGNIRSYIEGQRANLPASMVTL